MIVWTSSLDRLDWLDGSGYDPFHPAALVVLIVFPLLLAGVTIWAGLAVRALMTAPATRRPVRDEPAYDPADD